MEMAMRIEVEARNVYGKELIYPVNHEARLAAQLMGTKTLDPAKLGILQQMGIEVVEVVVPKLEDPFGPTRGPNQKLRGNYPELNRADGARYVGKDADGMAIYEGARL